MDFFLDETFIMKAKRSPVDFVGNSSCQLCALQVSRAGRSDLSFYSLPEFADWKVANGDWNKWKIKYYKGLGTSTAKEAKEYFSDMRRHRIRFRYSGPEDDRNVELAFKKDMADARKQWLTEGMEERRNRRAAGEC